MDNPASESFVQRHQFLILRLHSLSGLVPIGAYLFAHLATNASVLAGARTYQESVDSIHRLGPLLPFVEWGFIFLPIIFHAVVGVVIIRSGISNSAHYPYGKNIRYTLQRVTAWIVLFFIAWHVFQMHGWLPTETLRAKVAATGYGAQFDPHEATSSAALALRPLVVRIAYAIGVLSAVYHLANGIWTAGITWGVWTTPQAQRRADRLCIGFGVLLAAIGIGSLAGFARVDVDEARQVEAVLNEERERVEREIEKRLEESKPAEAATAARP